MAAELDMRERVLALVRRAAERVVAELDPAAEANLASIQVASSKAPEHGDFAANAALVLAKVVGLPPRAVAERLVAALDDAEGMVERVEIAGPGFLNFFLARGQWTGLLLRVLREGRAYGRSDVGSGRSVLVEFVSANPTGPLTIGHGRNAVLGDSVTRLLEATGHAVSREYYFNDGGRQMRVLAESLRARYDQQLGREAELPDEGYQGEYLVEVARELVREHGEGWLEAEEDAFRQRAADAVFAMIQRTLERLGIQFDGFVNERQLYDDGLVEKALADLRERGLVYERDGAVWLRCESFGLDRDRVLVRSSGEPTYMLPDVAYHRQKLERDLDLAIDVLGPDHIEQFPYVRAATAALGYAAERIECVMYQWVNLRRGEELVKMSTRKAAYVTIDEILDDVGADVFRYFMVERRGETHLDFDLELARERSDRNPVYKIQYAHARLCSIERTAAERGIERPEPEALPLARLESEAERDLVRTLERFPEIVAHAAAGREPQEVARYLLDLATAFHSYISDGRRNRVISADRELSLARLALVSAIRITLANGLELLGIRAPERM